MSISGNKISYDVDKNIFRAMLAVTLNISTAGYTTDFFFFFSSSSEVVSS